MQPALVRTVTESVRVPVLPAVKMMFLVPAPEVMVPFEMPQVYVAPDPAFGTDAALPVLPTSTAEGAEMVASGLALSVNVFVEESLPQGPVAVRTNVLEDDAEIVVVPVEGRLPETPGMETFVTSPATAHASVTDAEVPHAEDGVTVNEVTCGATHAVSTS